MRLQRWKHGLLSLLLVILVATAVILFAAYLVSTISQRIVLIEAADDIRLALLELRRYEKNMLLFKEGEHADKFHEQLKLLDKRIHDAGGELALQLKERHSSILEYLSRYKQDSASLMEHLKAEQQQLGDLRLLGRAVESAAARKALALELRRHEKNYLIYREQEAVDKLLRTAEGLVRLEPALNAPLRSYLAGFDALARTESLKEETVDAMRRSAREIEKDVASFAEKERAAIDRIISTSRKLFITSFIVLVLSAYFMATHFSVHFLSILKKLERSLNSLKSGDFSRTISIDPGSVPAEIASFVDAYNHTVTRLGISKAELESTLKRLERVNKEIVERQDELIEAERATAMRLLASEIVHEVNNPLSSVTMMLGMLYEDLPASDQRKETLGFILKEVDRCTLVLTRLTDVARQGPLRLKETDPSSLINEAIESALRERHGNGAAVTADLGRLPATIAADPVLMHQVLVNVLRNALQATPSGGGITIRGYTDDRGMVIAIHDTGQGIAEEKLAHIFEPFYTTKKEEGGTGLGLAIAKKIMEKHGGRIEIESAVGQGTLVTMIVPPQEKGNGQSTRH